MGEDGVREAGMEMVTGPGGRMVIRETGECRGLTGPSASHSSAGSRGTSRKKLLDKTACLEYTKPSG